MGITIIVKRNKNESGSSVTFKSRSVPKAKMYEDRSNVSGRHLSVIVPMAESMEPSELREHAHYLREKLKRDDITEDSISAKIEKGHHLTPKPSVKPSLKKRMAGG